MEMTRKCLIAQWLQQHSVSTFFWDTLYIYSLFQRNAPIQDWPMASSEKLCIRWTEFADNISNAFYDLKEDKDFTDMTLVCAEYQQVEVHKVVMAASSNFFKKVLKNIKHSHPLVYLKGVKIVDMEALLSFMYQGEVSLAEENLNSFLALAEELEVKGLTCSKNTSVGNHQPRST